MRSGAGDNPTFLPPFDDPRLDDLHADPRFDRLFTQGIQ